MVTNSVGRGGKIITPNNPIYEAFATAATENCVLNAGSQFQDGTDASGFPLSYGLNAVGFRIVTGVTPSTAVLWNVTA